MKQGTRANFTGNSLENYIYNALVGKGYQFIDKSKFDGAKYLDQPVFTAQFPIEQSIYGTQIFCDFILYHPLKYPDCLAIEAKWQQSSGSVDEKFPFLVANIHKYPCTAIVVLDGKGYKKEAEVWLRKQIDQKLIHVFNMQEFQKWSNGEEL